MAAPDDPPAPSAAAGHADYRASGTVDELTARNVRAIAQLDEQARVQRSAAARIGSAITRACGTLSFALVHAALFAAWIGWNATAGDAAFDPFPFTFLTLVVSLEAIFLSSFILIAQNEETRLTERRNALDLQINLLTEQENTKMLRMLQSIAQRVGAPLEDDPSLAALEEATRPDRLAEQIDRVTNGETHRGL